MKEEKVNVAFQATRCICAYTWVLYLDLHSNNPKKCFHIWGEF